MNKTLLFQFINHNRFSYKTNINNNMSLLFRDHTTVIVSVSYYHSIFSGLLAMKIH